jgi:ABC-2 type transport system permease protein
MKKRYIKIWWVLTLATSQISFQSRFGAILFMVGKIVRYVFFLFFLIILVTKTKTIAGYTFWEILFFYATFNFLDIIPQFFFRNVMRFRQQIVNGFFDNILTKPLPALFHPLFGGSDILDLVIVVASIALIIFAGAHIENVQPVHIAVYLLLLANGLLIATSFYIFVLGLGVLFTAVDNTMMLFRDIMQMGRLPVEVYQEPLRGFITFIIPVGIMVTFPGKALMGLLSLQWVVVAIIIGVILFIASLKFWHYALAKYSSASS